MFGAVKSKGMVVSVKSLKLNSHFLLHRLKQGRALKPISILPTY